MRKALEMDRTTLPILTEMPFARIVQAAAAAKQVARYDRPRKASIVVDAARYEATINPCHYSRQGDRELYEALAFLPPTIPT